MIHDINASFFHYMSTDEKPIHKFCPTGENSWCRYNRALAKKEAPPSHNPIIPRDLAKFVRPVFVHLSDRDLLDRCSLGVTHMWSLASKTQFLSKPTVTFAVNLSVIKFN